MNTVNIIKDINVDTIWSAMKKIKRKYVSINCIQGFIPVEDIQSQVMELAMELKIQGFGSETILDWGDITDTNMKIGSEMFLYLAACSEKMKPWFKFYEDLFQNHPLDQIILTMNRILKSSEGVQRMEPMKEIAEKLFSRRFGLLNVKF